MLPQDNQCAWLHGGIGPCTRIVPPPKRPLRLVLLGAPGAGKGTQAEIISEHYRLCHMSMGDVFRAAKNLDANALSTTMWRALDFMEHGKLVPDDTVIALVEERGNCLACVYGCLLDGFPRTVKQAEALERILGERCLRLDGVLNYVISNDEVVKRISGRLMCSACKTSLHTIFNPPKNDDICDKCGGQLFRRKDDEPESVKVRLDEYKRKTAPLVDFYETKGLLQNVHADSPPEGVFERTKTILSSYQTL